jgi:hypothetical protein
MAAATPEAAAIEPWPSAAVAMHSVTPAGA